MTGADFHADGSSLVVELPLVMLPGKAAGNIRLTASVVWAGAALGEAGEGALPFWEWSGWPALLRAMVEP